MYRDKKMEDLARLAAASVRSETQLPLPFNVSPPRAFTFYNEYRVVNVDIPPTHEPIGLVLGTGWGDVLAVDNPYRISLLRIPGFSHLRMLEGHARELVVGCVNGKQVLALRGRIHLNEAPDDNGEIVRMARLQIEMLLQLGVKNLILTSAVGALRREADSGNLSVGDICVVNGFVSLFAPAMPLWGGEFCSPEDALDQRLGRIALEECRDLRAASGGHVMVRGPQFEGRLFDKRLLAQTGARVVGMSGLDNACVAALYTSVRVLFLCFVTNDDVEEHSHEENLARAKASAAKLGEYLKRIIGRI